MTINTCNVKKTKTRFENKSLTDKKNFEKKIENERDRWKQLLNKLYQKQN